MSDKPTLKSLARAFGKVASNRRDLADTCVHKDDRDRSLMRALICMDIAEVLEIASQDAKLSSSEETR